MKTAKLAALILALLLQSAFGQQQAVTASSEASATAIKWFPGHYLTLASNQSREGWKVIAGKDHFVGGQRIYTWRQLEPEAGKYDFTGVEADLAFLRQQHQRLVLEIWDNRFDGHLQPDPDYLLTAAYHGGIAHPAQSPKVARTKRWVPAVMDRYLLLMEALGKRFDGDPDFAGLLHTETAMENKGSGFEDFSPVDFDTQMRRLVAASRKAFPHTPVIVFGNWYPYRGLEGLASLAKHAQETGVGWGGPDLVLGKKIWGYDIIRANAGRMPLGLSAQYDSFKGTWTAAQLLDLAQEMKLNFVFWGCFNRSKTGGLSFARDVLPVVEARNQDLVTARPANLLSSK